MNVFKRIIMWFLEDEGMTWERYHRNMEANKKKK